MSHTWPRARLFCVLLWLAWACVIGGAQAPVMDKIDPPGWWAGLPDPMLLVHGEGFDGAEFRVAGKGIGLRRTQVSANGHWAFLWLETANAQPQTVEITARNRFGQAQKAFALAARSQDPQGHRGFHSSDVLYLIMTDRFARGSIEGDKGLERDRPRGWHGGDFAGISQHLDYLQQLGVTAVWTTPVASNGTMPDSYHGYAATDLYAVDAHFGSMADYRRLSDALHARGMKLVMDLVPNHLGVQHPWVKDPPAPEWFHGTLEHHIGAQHDFGQLLDPHAARAAWRAITEGWFTDAMPDLNQENPLVSAYLIENAIWWIESAGIDGLRLDTFPYVGRAFWHEFHAELHELYPDLTTVGEIFNRNAEITSFFAGGVVRRGIDTGLDTPFDFPVYFALRDVLLNGRPMTELADVLRQDALYPHPERLVTFLGNHDTMRFFTAGHGSAAKLKLGLGLLATLRGMPQIYAGDEIAMAGGEDPDNRHDFPGGFPGDGRSAFAEAGRNEVEEDVFRWTAGLLALRKTHPVLQNGLEQNLKSTDDVFVFVRAQSEGGCTADPAQERLLVVVNNSEAKRQIDLPLADTALAGCTEFEPLASAAGPPPHLEPGKISLNETGESLTVYRAR
ncbi:alpha-amylase [Acidobacteria bacterium AB60]|nr:alpha-amylase [Acidobacteria bacterium AB60]